MIDPDDDHTRDGFSVASALRAPIGTQVEHDAMLDMRRGARALLVGMILIVLVFNVDIGLLSGLTVDVVPDFLGGLLVLLGVARVGRVAESVGPARARSRALMLAVLQFPLLLWSTVHPTELTAVQVNVADLARLVQIVIACLGTAIVGTVLGRAHDSLGQLSRRDRWSIARRASLVMAALVVPVGGLALDTDATGLHGALVGLASVLLVTASVLVLLLVGRALVATMNVMLPDR